MPIYKITQQQGNRVITSTLEAKSVPDLVAFLTAVSTAEIKYIYKVEFETQKTTFPLMTLITISNLKLLYLIKIVCVSKFYFIMLRKLKMKMNYLRLLKRILKLAV